MPTAHKCSICDLDWKRHGEKPTLKTCIDLLKADLAKPRPMYSEVVGSPYVTTIGKGINGEANKGISL